MNLSFALDVLDNAGQVKEIDDDKQKFAPIRGKGLIWVLSQQYDIVKEAR